MAGLAEKLFKERAGVAGESPPSSTLDASLAKMLLRPFPEAGREERLFLRYLSAAVRHGHLCVHLEGTHLSPSPEILEINEEEASLCRGAEKLPKELFQHTLHREGARIYFQRYWQSEKSCFQQFLTLLHREPKLQIDPAFAKREVELLISKNLLLPDQGEAILKACRHSLLLLSGGPGTGKTYTVSHLLSIFPKQCSIALAAPTGKAAAQLEKNLKGLKAETLHALLKRGDSLAADIVIVDESSMIDLNTMHQLLAAIKPGARLILLGDRYQLSPVDSGTLFADFVSYCQQHRAFEDHVIELKRCFRAELAAIVACGQAIQQGDAERVLTLLKSGDIQYHTIENEFSLQRELVEALVTRLSERSDSRSLCLLSPLRKGPLGVDALNQLAASLHKNPSPIIITKTDRRLKLFNGEVGILLENQEALFKSPMGEERRIPLALLPPYQYAYCLSIHKSQGSEFDEVWVVLPKGSELFGRELLYTAVTRARKKVRIWSRDEVLKATVEKQVRRLSGIC